MTAVVVNEEAARAILAAGGFLQPDMQVMADVRWNLDVIARALIQDHYIHRWQDEKKKRLRERPRKEARQTMHADLDGLWAGLPGVKELAAVTYSKGKYGGDYVRFVRAFAGVVADHVESDPSYATPLWGGLVKTLRRLQHTGGDRSNPVSTAIHRWASAQIVPLTDIQAVVLRVVTDYGKADAARIAAILHKPADEVQSVLTSLYKLGRITHT